MCPFRSFSRSLSPRLEVVTGKSDVTWDSLTDTVEDEVQNASTPSSGRGCPASMLADLKAEFKKELHSMCESREPWEK